MRLWIGFTFLLMAATGAAETRYVTDELSVELRRGPSLEYLILRSLPAGEAVDVLEQNADDGYSRVRVLDQGTEGWILSRFLENEPAARDRLTSAERNLTAERERNAELATQVTTLSEKLGTLEATLLETQGAHEQASTELADIRSAAANVVEIREQNASLRQRLIERESELDRLSIENSALSNRRFQEGFVIGAGVLIAGIIMGLVAPSLRRRRRTDW